ncbi:MAG: flagellar hook basal-body protein [Candidatus Margulisbacteria bacterium]|nr:flagellar hook basal-body protein [Candidatus Margulisiibacteriota bacterium]
MLDIMNNAKNAIEAYNQALEAHSANIANMSVTGYKSVEVSFQSIYEKLINAGTAASGNMGGTNPMQFGQGMSVSATTVNFSQGDFTEGSSSDLGINGQGLFIVSADGGTTYQYTRAGNFEIDSLGNLTSNGFQVYGLDSSGNLTAISNLPSGTKTDYNWLEDGTLEYSSDSGTTYTGTGYRIALTYFSNPGGLAQTQGTCFAATSASGVAADPSAPGGAVGTIKPGYVENSNVFYLGETIDAQEIQRAMSGNLTILTMASDMISTFISKIS